MSVVARRVRTMIRRTPTVTTVGHQGHLLPDAAV
jgi:hypothetical protein